MPKDRILYAQAMRAAGEYAAAVAILKDLLAQAPGRADAHQELGCVYGFTGQFEEAIAELKEAVRLAPEDNRCLLELGKTYAMLGMTEEAQAIFASVPVGGVERREQVQGRQQVALPRLDSFPGLKFPPEGEHQMPMLWQRFTPNAKRAVMVAQEAAEANGDPTVTPEHLLLALTSDRTFGCNRLFDRMAIHPGTVQQELTRKMQPGPGKRESGGATLDARTKRLLDLAYQEARSAQHQEIKTGHLVLGILLQGDGLAFQTLTALGADIVKARAAAGIATLETAKSPPSPPPPPTSPRRTFQVGKFDDPASATAWINERLQQQYEVVYSGAGGSSFWVVMRGYSTEEPQELQKKTLVKPSGKQPAESQHVKAKGAEKPRNSRKKNKD